MSRVNNRDRRNGKLRAPRALLRQYSPLDVLLFGPIVVALTLLAAFLVNRTQR